MQRRLDLRLILVAWTRVRAFHSHMRVAVLFFALMTSFVLGGCANNAYYQTRYMPTSSEETYSASQRLFWREDSQVYDLPSNPPALASEAGADDDHRVRADCAMPGPEWKTDRLAAGNGAAIQGRSQVDGVPLVSIHEERVGVPLSPERLAPTGGWHDERILGARDTRVHEPISGYDQRPIPVPGEGINRQSYGLVAGMRDDQNWCPPTKR